MDQTQQMSRTKSAINNNDKLWPLFKQRLSAEKLKGMPGQYLTTAHRFDVWLSSEKAYYTLARPQIVDILEIASDAVCRNFPEVLVNGAFDISRCPPANHSILETTVKIIRTAGQFYNMFVEDDLRSRLRVLLLRSGVDRRVLPQTGSAKKSSGSPAPIPRSGSSSSVASTYPEASNPLSSQILSAPPTRQMSVSVPTFPTSAPLQPAVWDTSPKLSVSITDQTTSVPMANFTQATQEHPNAYTTGGPSPVSATASNVPSLTIRPTNLPSGLSSVSTSQVSASTSQPVPTTSTSAPIALTRPTFPPSTKKAKAKEPTKNFLEADLDWFRKQKSSQSSSPVVSSTTPTFFATAALPSPSISSPLTASTFVTMPSPVSFTPSTATTPPLSTTTISTMPSSPLSAPLISAISIPPSQVPRPSWTSTPILKSFDDSQKSNVGLSSEPSTSVVPAGSLASAAPPFVPQAPSASDIAVPSPSPSQASPSPTDLPPMIPTPPQAAASPQGGQQTPSPIDPPSQLMDEPSVSTLSPVETPTITPKPVPPMYTRNSPIDFVAQDGDETKRQLVRQNGLSEPSDVPSNLDGAIAAPLHPGNVDDIGAQDVEPMQVDEEVQRGDATEVNEKPETQTPSASFTTGSGRADREPLNAMTHSEDFLNDAAMSQIQPHAFPVLDIDAEDTATSLKVASAVQQSSKESSSDDSMAADSSTNVPSPAPLPPKVASSSPKPVSLQPTPSDSMLDLPAQTTGDEPSEPIRFGPPKRKPATKARAAKPPPIVPPTQDVEKTTIRLSPKLTLVYRRPSQESATGLPEVVTPKKGEARKRTRSPGSDDVHERGGITRSTAGQASTSSQETVKDASLPPVINRADDGTDQLIEEEALIEPSREEDDPWPVLGRETCVVAVERGRPGPATFVLKVPLQASHWELVKMWKTAGTNRRDVTKTMCVLLACYRFDELDNLRREDPGVTKERLYTEVKPVSFMHHPFTSNVLSSTMHELTFTFPPTFMKRNHNLVDLSTFLREGANDVTFTQRSNLADYVFVVLAHHPTPRQLELVDAQRSRETRWRSVLDRAAAPLQPPTPSWIEFISRPWPVTEPLPMSG